MGRGPHYNEGAYIGKVLRQELGCSGKKDTPTFFLVTEIIGMIDKADPDGELINTGTPQERTIYIYLTEGTMEFALDNLRFIGFDKNSLKYLDPDTEGFVDFTGKEIPLYCKHEDYQGNVNEKWQISKPRAAAKPIDQGSLRKLDALFGSAAKKAPAPTRTPAMAAQRSNAADAGVGDVDDVNRRLAEAGNAEDDIPF